jgi:hypothetical protein
MVVKVMKVYKGMQPAARVLCKYGLTLAVSAAGSSPGCDSGPDDSILAFSCYLQLWFSHLPDGRQVGFCTELNVQWMPHLHKALPVWTNVRIR